MKKNIYKNLIFEKVSPNLKNQRNFQIWDCEIRTKTMFNAKLKV